METKQRLAELGAGFQALLDLLLESGVVGEAEFRERLAAAADAELSRAVGDTMVVLSEVPDKYGLSPDQAVQIDCEARLHLCQARCCTQSFALSTQDLDERVVRWEYGRPYEIARNRDGYCVHNRKDGWVGAEDDGSGRSRLHLCTIYEKRPASCRTYDCRNDKRIWENFEKMIPAK